MFFSPLKDRGLRSIGKEIDELVDEWTPEPLAQPLNPVEQYELDSQPVIQGATGPKPKLVSTGKTVLKPRELQLRRSLW